MKKLIEITPVPLRCGGVGTRCPALFKDGDNYVVVGEQRTAADYPDLAGRVGSDEMAVEVPAELLEDVLKALDCCASCQHGQRLGNARYSCLLSDGEASDVDSTLLANFVCQKYTRIISPVEEQHVITLIHEASNLCQGIKDHDIVAYVMQRQSAVPEDRVEALLAERRRAKPVEV